MTDFEFAFSLYSLLLGFSLVSVIGGLARALEVKLIDESDVHEVTRIGWLTPLLAVFVLLDLLSFWSAAWGARNLVSVSPAALLSVVAFASSYYFAAHLVFPSGSLLGKNLDAHFFRVRRVVLGVLLALIAAQFAFYLSIPQLRSFVTAAPSLLATSLLIVLMAAAMFVRRPVIVTTALAALIARYVVLYIV